MKMECDLMLDCINGSLPLKSKGKEEIEKHLTVCWECQELVELTSELPYLMNAGTFSAGMKERILTLVFEKKTDSDAMLFF